MKVRIDLYIELKNFFLDLYKLLLYYIEIILQIYIIQNNKTNVLSIVKYQILIHLAKTEWKNPRANTHCH